MSIFRDKSLGPDIDMLDGGMPLTDRAQFFVDVLNDIPGLPGRLIGTDQGRALLLYGFATIVGLAAMDFDVANAMVENSLNHGVGKKHGKNHAGFSGGVDGDGVVDPDGDLHTHRDRHSEIDVPLPDSNVSLDIIASAGIESGLGLVEVDSVKSLALGDGGVGDQLLNKLYEKTVVDSSGSQAVAILLNPAVVELSDTTLVDASTKSDHLRTMRGGFDTIPLESTHIVFGTAPNGQAVVVLAKNVDGSLTGFKDGSEDGKIFGMQFGSGEASNLLGIMTTIDGIEVFQPLLDPTSGRVLVPTGTIKNGIATYMADLEGGNKPLAQVIPLEGYESPVFSALQDMVAQEESGRFTLTSVEDGLLFDGKPTGVSVDKNGVMTIDVNGSDVVIDQSQIHFSDDGLQIDGFEDKNLDGNWESSISPAESAATKLLEDNDITSDTYTQTVVDGVVMVTDKETGKVMMQSSESGVLQGIEFATKIAANSCEPTPYKPSPGGMIVPNNDYLLSPTDYFSVLVNEEFKYRSNSGYFTFILVDKEKQCWAISDGLYYFYRDKEGVGKQVPLIPLTPAELDEFAFTPR